MIGKAKDLTGQRMGDYTVKSFACLSPNGTARWNCSCDCGIEKEILSTHLRRGIMCQCKRWAAVSEAQTKHGMSGTKTYRSWRSMKLRCLNPEATDYDIYGGRGIKVCERWVDSFENFLEDMGERPVGKTLDRINTDGNYEPGNCKWSTPKEQAQNRRSRK